MAVVALLSAVLVFLSQSVSSVEWTYDSSSSACGSASSPCGPDYWYKVNANCNSDDYSQSPINIESKAIKDDSDFQGPVVTNSAGCKVRILVRLCQLSK
jgi:carbonic anhydrase